MKYNPIEFYQKEGWKITSPYGPRSLDSYHYGIDFGGLPRGTDVKTPYGGVVVGVGEYGERGKTVSIRIAEGILQITQHHDSVKVKVGQEVRTGDIIATNGITGKVTGPHIHYELRKDIPSVSGRPIGRYVWGDPAKFFMEATEDEDRKSHVVQKGDTLYNIGKKYGVTVDEIREWNNRTPEDDRKLSIGTVLWVSPPLPQNDFEKKYEEAKAEIEVLKGQLESAGKKITELKFENEHMRTIGAEILAKAAFFGK